MTAVLGIVYLLHFDRPYRHARHYTGWTTDLPARLADHAAGRGARLLEVAIDAQIGWRLARTWPGDRARERQLKHQGGAARRCPLCPGHQRLAAQCVCPACGTDVGYVIPPELGECLDCHERRTLTHPRKENAA
jgi:predicted GIY-YIG superfamily endonuclease